MNLSVGRQAKSPLSHKHHLEEVVKVPGAQEAEALNICIGSNEDFAWKWRGGAF